MNTPDTLTFKVTSTDIRLGVQEDCEDCAVSLALQRATGADVAIVKDHILLGDGRIDEKGNMIYVKYDMPQELYNFVEQFDTKKSACRPTEFTIVKTKR